MVNPINELFGIERANALRNSVDGASSELRQEIVGKALTSALNSVGAEFVLPFDFRSNHGDRTSHYMIFVSKAFAGYHIMKNVMAELSTDASRVKSFVHDPLSSGQLTFFSNFDMSRLKSLLRQQYMGQTLKVFDAYRGCTVGTPYTLRNVQDALIELEECGHVTVDRPREKRIRRGVVTLGEERRVTFLE